MPREFLAAAEKAMAAPFGTRTNRPDISGIIMVIILQTKSYRSRVITFLARRQHLFKNPAALTLAAIVFVALMASCMFSGVSGAIIPLALKKLGADPATVSSIFLTVATDVECMGTFPGLAMLLIR